MSVEVWVTDAGDFLFKPYCSVILEMIHTPLSPLPPPRHTHTHTHSHSHTRASLTRPQDRMVRLVEEFRECQHEARALGLGAASQRHQWAADKCTMTEERGGPDAEPPTPMPAPPTPPPPPPPEVLEVMREVPTRDGVTQTEKLGPSGPLSASEREEMANLKKEAKVGWCKLTLA